MMEHRKLEGLMSPMEKVARVASGGLRAASAQTSPSGAISLDNADGTRTIIGEVSNGEDNPSYTMATHVGDTTPPGVPTGITATSKSGVVVVEWDGTLSGGIPDDFFCVRIFLDNVELGALSEAGSVASAKLESGTTHSITATSEDDCCLPDGTPAHNVSDATQAISVTVAKDASEVMADIDEQIEGVEQEIADFKSNTYTKVQVDKKVQDLDDEISTELTTNYYNKTQIDTTYATKTLVSQTKDEIELSASQTYANKGAGNPNLSPFFAHDFADVWNETSNPDGYWTETPAHAAQLADGWAHLTLDNTSGTGTMYSRIYVRATDQVPAKATLLVEVRNLVTNVTSTTADPRVWINTNLSNSQLKGSTFYFMEDGAYLIPLTGDAAWSATYLTRWWFATSRGGNAEFDARISVYANAEATIDGQQVTLPYDGSFKPYVTGQESLAKTYATNSALTVGLDGIRTEVSGTYATKGIGNPNLCPFYSVPSGGTEFWMSTAYPYYSLELSRAGLNPAGRQLADGWGHYDIDVSGQSASGGETTAFCNIRCLASYAGDWKPSTDYTLLAEFRNVEFHDGATVRRITFLPVRKTSATQKSIFESPTGAAIYVTEDATLRIPLKTYADLSGRTQVTDGYLSFAVGALVSFDVRLSIYEGDYDGPFKPYVTDQESLSKTYTKSSTFVQTVDGLDGRITATEDGLAVQETLIRQYAGGVLVCKVGENIGALVNATGSFDVVGVSWNGDEPTVTGTFSTFMQSLIELGKGNTNAEIQFCDNTGNISVQQNYKGNQAITMDADNTTIHGDEDVYVAAGAEWGQYALVSELSKMVELHAATSSTQMGNIRVSPTSVGIDYTTSQAAGASISMLDVTPEGGSAYPVLDLYVSGGPIEMNASGGVKVLGPTGEGTAMRGIFFGSKIINPNGAAYGTLFTQAECVSRFGRALNNNKDVVLVMNGDTNVYGGQMTASLNGSSEVRVYMSPTRSGNTRINYLVILGA